MGTEWLAFVAHYGAGLGEQSRYDAKLARILREASTIFAQKGYHRASIRDISAATGVSLSGLYYYVQSKDELLFLIQRNCFDTILANLEVELCEVTGAEQRLTVLIANHLSFFANNMSEMKVLSHEADALSGAYAKEIAEQKRAYSATVTEMLEALAPEARSVDLRIATFSLFGMMNWIYTWYRPDRDGPVEALTDEMTRLFFGGFPAGVARSGAPVDGACEVTSAQGAD